MHIPTTDPSLLGKLSASTILANDHDSAILTFLSMLEPQTAPPCQFRAGLTGSFSAISKARL